MGQSGGRGRTERRTEWCRCEVGQTKKYRRPDRPNRPESWDSAGVEGTACIGTAKQEKLWEVRDAWHTQQGQDRELCPILHLIGEVLHCSIPPTPSPPKPKKRMRERKRRKSVFFRVWGGRFKKKTTNTSVDTEFSPIMCLAFPSFHSTPHHWITIIPSHGFPHLAQNNFWVLWPVLRYCVHSTLPG
jgi:hypothetical protein